MLLLITAIAGWVGVTKAGLNPGSSAARLGKATSGLHLSRLVCPFIAGIRRHSPRRRHLGRCLKLGRQHIYPLLRVSEVKVISLTRIQEHKPATQCSTTCLSDVKAIFSTSSQYRPALVKQHGFTTAGDETPVLGRHQLNGSRFKVFITFLITSNFQNLKKMKPKLMNLLNKMLIRKGFFSSLFLFFVKTRRSLYKMNSEKTRWIGFTFMVLINPCLCSCILLPEDFFKWLF